MRRLYLIAALFCAAPAAAWAQVRAAVLSDAQQGLLEHVGQYLNGITAMTGRFLQTAPDSKVSTGTFWLERPGRMRFQYDPPSPLLLVAGGGKVTFHDSKLDQTSDIPIGQTPLGLLLGPRISLSGDVTVTDFQQLPGQVQLTLVRTQQPGEGSLTLYLNTQPLSLTGWTVVDAEGKETHVQLSGMHGATQFDQALFSFSDPDEDK